MSIIVVKLSLLLIVKTLANKKDPRSVTNMPLDSTLSFVKSQGPGIFVIGLGNHVGFIHNGGKVYGLYIPNEQTP